MVVKIFDDRQWTHIVLNLFDSEIFNLEQCDCSFFFLINVVRTWSIPSWQLLMTLSSVLFIVVHLLSFLTLHVAVNSLSCSKNCLYTANIWFNLLALTSDQCVTSCYNINTSFREQMIRIEEITIITWVVGVQALTNSLWIVG